MQDDKSNDSNTWFSKTKSKINSRTLKQWPEIKIEEILPKKVEEKEDNDAGVKPILNEKCLWERLFKELPEGTPV